jgi:hypothetical protein
VVAEPDRDGYFAEWRMVPPGDVLFGGAFGDPDAWDTPVSDRLLFTLPADAEPGTYRFTVKARREWYGETRLAAVTVPIEVGIGGEETTPWVGKCETCHEDALHLDGILHHNDDLVTCNGCHVPLDFEPDNLLAYRMHYVHYFSPRYPDPKGQCRSCHEVVQSIQRPSYLACLGCHLEYHGGAEGGLYGQCADVIYCHPDHTFPSLTSFEVDSPWDATSGPAGADGSLDADGSDLTAGDHPHADEAAPVAARTSIPYRLTHPGTVTITIHDVQGRRVASLLQGEPRPAGTHVAPWDGRSRAGRAVPPGVYYARVTTPDGVHTSRVHLLR